MEADLLLLDRGGLVGVVEEDQGVQGGGVVVVLAAAVLFLEFVAGGDAFFGQEAADEVAVGFPVLQAVGALGVVLGQAVLPAAGGSPGAAGVPVFGQEGVHDLGNALVLEDPAVGAVGEQGKAGDDDQGEAGEAAVGAFMAGFGDEAGDGLVAAVGQQQVEFGDAADQLLEFQMGVGGEAPHFHPVVAGDGFFSPRFHRQQLLRTNSQYPELQQPRLLYKGAGVGR